MFPSRRATKSAGWAIGRGIRNAVRYWRDAALSTQCTGSPVASRPRVGLPAMGILLSNPINHQDRPCAVLAMARLQTTEVKSVPANIHPDREHDDMMYPQILPFLVVHASCLAAIWSGITWQATAIC